MHGYKTFAFAAAGLVLGLSSATSLRAQCEVTELVSTAPTTDYELGGAVDIDGGRAIVGAPGSSASGASSGAAYVYERINGKWSVAQNLGALCTLQSMDRFGFAVALSGDVALVGAHTALDASGIACGRVDVFRRAASGAWTHEQRLAAPSGVFGDHFGRALAIAGNRMLVGAPRRNEAQGVVYAYKYNASATPPWNPEGAALKGALVNGAEFGNAIAMTAGVAVIGEFKLNLTVLDSQAHAVVVNGAGQAHVFELTPFPLPQWTFAQVLRASDQGGGGTQYGYSFGSSVDVSGSRIAIGARNKSLQLGHESGGAYVYELDASSGRWGSEVALTPSNLIAGDHYGAVALSGDTLVVGAPDNQDFGMYGGTAYLHRFAAGVWSAGDKLTAPQNQLHPSRYGFATAIAGDEIAIGAPYLFTGSAYVWSALGQGFLSFAIQPSTVSLAGGACALQLDSCAQYAGNQYLIVGSGGLVGADCAPNGLVPLCLDTYFATTLATPNFWPLQGSVGQLDANGDATAAIVVQPGLPSGVQSSLLGTKLHFAYGVLANPLFVSNAVSVQFVP